MASLRRNSARARLGWRRARQKNLAAVTGAVARRADVRAARARRGAHRKQGLGAWHSEATTWLRTHAQAPPKQLYSGWDLPASIVRALYASRMCAGTQIASAARAASHPITPLATLSLRSHSSPRQPPSRPAQGAYGKNQKNRAHVPQRDARLWPAVGNAKHWPHESCDMTDLDARRTPRVRFASRHRSARVQEVSRQSASSSSSPSRWSR